jgi:hypothetical protein
MTLHIGLVVAKPSLVREGFAPPLLTEMIKEVIEAAGSTTTDAQDKPNPEVAGTENTV